MPSPNYRAPKVKNGLSRGQRIRFNRAARNPAVLSIRNGRATTVRPAGPQVTFATSTPKGIGPTLRRAPTVRGGGLPSPGSVAVSVARLIANRGVLVAPEHVRSGSVVFAGDSISRASRGPRLPKRITGPAPKRPFTVAPPPGSPRATDRRRINAGRVSGGPSIRRSSGGPY